MMNNNGKLKDNMSTMDMIITMSEGNPGAIQVIMQMMSDPDPIRFLDILLLDGLDIRGSQLYMLWSDCSDKNMEKYFRTLTMLRNGIFSEEQIKANLNLVYAIPFIDDSISPEETPAYGEEFGPDHPVWEEFCRIQREGFISKLEAELEVKKVL